MAKDDGRKPSEAVKKNEGGGQTKGEQTSIAHRKSDYVRDSTPVPDRPKKDKKD